MGGFFFIWGVTFLMAFITGMFDRGYKEPFLHRALRAAGYTFVFCIVIVILAKLGISGSGDEYGETYYRR